VSFIVFVAIKVVWICAGYFSSKFVFDRRAARRRRYVKCEVFGTIVRAERDITHDEALKIRAAALRVLDGRHPGALDGTVLTVDLEAVS
jgi:hypothetical protein